MIEETDTTMYGNAKELADTVVGHRIIKAEIAQEKSYWDQKEDVLQLTLDNGHKVNLFNTSDCCAFTELKSFVYNPDKVDHIITGVSTENDYETWHIYADMGDVLELSIGWSYGNPYYYGYGFDIQVQNAV